MAGICENIPALEYPIDNFKRVGILQTDNINNRYLISTFLGYFQQHKQLQNI